MLLNILHARFSVFMWLYHSFFAPRFDATGIGHPCFTHAGATEAGAAPTLPVGQLPAGILDKPRRRQ